MKKRSALFLLALVCLIGLFAMTATADEAPSASIEGHNLSLNDNIYIIYYAEFENLPVGAEKGILVWTSQRESYEYGTQYAILPVYTGNNYGYDAYYFTGVSAKMMTQDIYAKAYVKVGDEITYGELDKYSVLQYCYNKTGSTTMQSGSTITLGELIQDILHYGASAQKYFNFNPDRLATANYYEINVVNGKLPDGTNAGLFQLGEQVTLTATIENFDHWENKAGATVGTESTLVVTVSGTGTYTAVERAGELSQIAVQFKLDYEANYLGLYSEEVAKMLRDSEDEGILKITAATSNAVAQSIADEYIAKLKAAKTLADEVAELVAKIGDVSLADEDEINLMLYYDKTLNNAIAAGATGAKKVVLDAYKADANLQKAILAISVRFELLKAAKIEADGDINVRILEMRYRFETEGVVWGLSDLQEMLLLQEDIDAFAERYELVDGTDAYREILKIDDFNAAQNIFETKTKDDPQIQRALTVVRAAKNLRAAAAEAESTNYTWVDDDDLFFWDSTIYWMDQATFHAGSDIKKNSEGKTLRLTNGQGVIKFVNPNDTFPSVQAANDANFWQLYACQAPRKDGYDYEILYSDVTGSTRLYAMAHYDSETAARAAGVENPIRVEDPNVPTSYKLSLQAAIEEAAWAAHDFRVYIPQAGTIAYRECITLIAYYQEILSLIEAYNESLTVAKEKYDAFKDLIVEMNYVDVYPEKEATYADYTLTTDTQTEKKYWSKLVWKEKLYDEIEEVYRSARTPSEIYNSEAYIRSLFKTADYPFTAWFFDNQKVESAVNVRENEDGSYSLYLSYLAFTYRWKVSTLDRTDTVEVTAENTQQLDLLFPADSMEGDEILADYLAKAEAFLVWVETYIGTDLPDTFDLRPYSTVAFGNVFDNTVEYERIFGRAVLTFSDDKLEEVADTQIHWINGQVVDATPTEALDVTVYADINVARAIIAESERRAAEKEAALRSLDDAVRALFAPSEEDVISAARKLYNKVLNRYGLAAIEAWRKDNSTFTQTYLYIMDGVEQLCTEASALYPWDTWDAALADLFHAMVLADADCENFEKILAAYDVILDAAKADLEYLERGYAIGWTTYQYGDHQVAYIPEDTTANGGAGRATEHPSELMNYRLVDGDVVEAAREKVAALNEWRLILTYAAVFISDNDAYAAEYAHVPGWGRNPACIDFNEDLVAQLSAYLVWDEPYVQYGAEEDEFVPFTIILNTMATILNDAQSVVRYHRQNYVVVVYDVEANYDLAALRDKQEAARAAYNTKLEELQRYNRYYFNPQGQASYNRLANIDALIEDIYNFLGEIVIGSTTDSRGCLVALHPDYVNLNLYNQYTNSCVDLFSEIFNARIMAAYYKSVVLTEDFAAGINKLAQLRTVDPFDEEYEVAWSVYAYSYVAYGASSRATFATLPEAVGAIKTTYLCVADDGIDYEWAKELMGLATEAELDAFDDALAHAAFADTFDFTYFASSDD